MAQNVLYLGEFEKNVFIAIAGWHILQMSQLYPLMLLFNSKNCPHWFCFGQICFGQSCWTFNYDSRFIYFSLKLYYFFLKLFVTLLVGMWMLRIQTMCFLMVPVQGIFWNKSHLVMVYYHFYVLLDWMFYIFFIISVSVIYKECFMKFAFF